MKQCSKCKIPKDLLEFYKDKRTPSGVKAQCNVCHIEGSMKTRNLDKKRESNKKHMAIAREKDINKFRKRDREAAKKRSWCEKRKARYLLNRAVQRGLINKPEKCIQCGIEVKLEGHHSDYSKPLDVVWLCSKCHGQIHRLSS